MLEIRTARSGEQTARVEGTYIHSPYDPVKEARRFIRQSLRAQYPSLIILLGAGLGYLYAELRRALPSARIVLVFYHEALPGAFRHPLPPGSYWHPGAGQSLLGFLRCQVHELEAEGLLTLEWPPSARIFARRSMKANQAIHQLIREIRGTLVTTSALGRLWLKNSLFNFIGIDEVFPAAWGRSGRAPVVIAASGPTLQEGIDFLALHRRKIELWALPSSLLFLLSRGLRPDTVILTDPGYYAFSHLQCAKAQQIHLTMPLTAARGSWRIDARVSLLNQDTPFERLLLERAGYPAPAVPAQGTVSATALLLALRLRSAPVIFVGLDFCYRDIFSHARPNNFENWLMPGSGRLEPFHHRLFALAAERAPKKAEGGRGNLALETYAGWFAEAGACGIGKTEAGGPTVAGQENRIFRLHPSDIEIPGIEGIDEQEAGRLIGSYKGQAAPPAGAQRALPSYPSRLQRSRIVLDLLGRWIERTDRIRSAVAASGSMEALMGDYDSLSMIYLCNAAQLTETRRILRLRGPEAGAGKASAVLNSHLSFLRDLRKTLAGSS
jgi:hypothetical protein